MFVLQQYDKKSLGEIILMFGFSLHKMFKTSKHGKLNPCFCLQLVTKSHFFSIETIDALYNTCY